MKGRKNSPLWRARIVLGASLLISLGYTTIRHNLLGEVPWSLLPLYTLNKALAWSGLNLLAFTFLLRWIVKQGFLKTDWLDSRKHLGKQAFNLLLFHALLTVMLFRTEYGIRFVWIDEHIRIEGISSIILGSAALALLAWYYKQASVPGRKSSLFRKSPLFLLMAAFLHPALWGWNEWWLPSDWHGYTPPASIISSLTAFTAFLLLALRPPE